MGVRPQIVGGDQHANQADELVPGQRMERLAEVNARARRESQNRLAVLFAEIGLIQKQGQLLFFGETPVQHEHRDQALFDFRQARMELVEIQSLRERLGDRGHALTGRREVDATVGEEGGVFDRKQDVLLFRREISQRDRLWP